MVSVLGPEDSVGARGLQCLRAAELHRGQNSPCFGSRRAGRGWWVSDCLPLQGGHCRGHWWASPCGFFNYGLMLRLMLFIQISSLLLVLWPFLSCFPSCLLSLTGKELCSCWCGFLLQPGVGCEPQTQEHCTFLCTGFLVSLVFVLCHPLSYPFYRVFPLQVGDDLPPEVAPTQLELPCAVLPAAGK